MSDAVSTREATRRVAAAVSAIAIEDRETEPITIPSPKFKNHCSASTSGRSSLASGVASVDAACPHVYSSPESFPTEAFSPTTSSATCGSCHEKQESVKEAVADAVKFFLFESSLRTPKTRTPRPTHDGAYPPTIPRGTREHFSDLFSEWAASSKGKSIAEIWSTILQARLKELISCRGKLDSKLASERDVDSVVRDTSCSAAYGHGEEEGNNGSGKQRASDYSMLDTLAGEIEKTKVLFREQFPAPGDVERELESIAVRMKFASGSGLGVGLALRREREALLQRLSLVLVTNKYLARVKVVFEANYSPRVDVDNASIVALVEAEIAKSSATTTTAKLQTARHLFLLLSEESSQCHHGAQFVPEA